MSPNPLLADLNARIIAAKRHVEYLKQQLAIKKNERAYGNLTEAASTRRHEIPALRKLSCSRTLLGHGATNVTSVHWSGINQDLVSVGADGQIVIWDGLNRKRRSSYTHRTQWLMSCAFERNSSELIAAGGADKFCSIFSVAEREAVRPLCELIGHDGYLSCCRFLHENNLVTSSGDSTAILWDIQYSKSNLIFREHAADCLSVAVNPRISPSIFATGSGDCTAKLWDIRIGGCTQTFTGHDSDVNDIEFFPDGHGIGTASTDSTCKIFDTRYRGLVVSFESDGSQTPATSGTYVRTLSNSKVLNPY